MINVKDLVSSALYIKWYNSLTPEFRDFILKKNNYPAINSIKFELLFALRDIKL